MHVKNSFTKKRTKLKTTMVARSQIAKKKPRYVSVARNAKSRRETTFGSLKAWSPLRSQWSRRCVDERSGQIESV